MTNGPYQGGGPRAPDTRPNQVVRTTPTIELSDIKFGEGLNELIFADIAQEMARIVATAGKVNKNNKSSQLRKFYDELVMWQEKVALEQNAEARQARYRELAPYIKMLTAKVAYARARNHVDVCFEKLFGHVVRQIQCPETLKQAKLFIEAFMGFYKAEEK